MSKELNALRVKAGAASCDITDFGPHWPAFKAALGIEYAGRGEHGFLWRGLGIEVETGNNPETGEYRIVGARESQPGFASYIGASGERVGDFKAALYRFAIYRKSPIADSRCYI